jgi:hypothetical protein
MRVSSRLSNLGIEIRVGTDDAPAPTPAPDADQTKPRRSYVYAHLDVNGRIFYIGKGEGRRAWSDDRHPIWYRYVEKHLGGKYEVRILQDDLSAEEAEGLEADWIAYHCNDLVNWVNLGRPYDHEALERQNKLQAANRTLIHQAKAVEKRDLAKAADMYAKSIDSLKEYAGIVWDGGIIGKLIAEENEEFGLSGEIEALDRLTMALIKLGRTVEAVDWADRYFAAYRRDTKRSAAAAIRKRIAKASASL